MLSFSLDGLSSMGVVAAIRSNTKEIETLFISRLVFIYGGSSCYKK